MFLGYYFFLSRGDKMGVSQVEGVDRFGRKADRDLIFREVELRRAKGEDVRLRREKDNLTVVGEGGFLAT
jgi:hypothetical protein